MLPIDGKKRGEGVLVYSLIIAEDELTTRRGLVNMVKWNELGFSVDGVFSDGQELLDDLKNNMPDVILTDIKMSRVSGVDIARFVAEQNLPVQIVFLSGYRNFDFAQSAVEYRVLHYLLKPVSIPKLREVFMGIKEKLDQQNALQYAMLNRVDHYQKLVNYQKQQFVTDAWSGALVNPQQLKEHLLLFSVKPYSNPEPRLFLVRLAIRNDPQYMGFLTDYGLQELQEQMISILGALDQRLEYYPINWEENKAGRALSGLGVLWKKEDFVSGQDSPIRMWEIKEQLHDQVYQLIGIWAELAVLREMDSPAELISCTKSFEKAEMVQIQSNTGIENVLRFIWEHYCEDITLSDVAGEVYLNPIYISRLIKEQTGKNYTDILRELRIGKAVELLKNTDLYVYEIADKVGYHNLKYFYKVFRKVKGNSPNDYRPKQKRNKGKCNER